VESLYDILEVSRTASPEVIRAAYKSLVQRFHPDRNPDNPDAEERIKRINHAYDILSDQEERAAYDVMLAIEEMPAPEIDSGSKAPEEAAVPTESAPGLSAKPAFKRPALVIAGGVSIALIASTIVFFSLREKAKPPAASPLPAPRPLASVAPPRPQPVPLLSPAEKPAPKLPETTLPASSPVVMPASIKPVEKRRMPRPEQKALPQARAVPPPVAAIPQARPTAEVSKYADLASAVLSGDRAAVEKMIKGGEDVNLARGNQVPLIIAVKNGDAAMVKLLLSLGADVNLTDNQGNTAMIYAKVRADAKMIEILKNAGAKNPFD